MSTFIQEQNVKEACTYMLVDMYVYIVRAWIYLELSLLNVATQDTVDTG